MISKDSIEWAYCILHQKWQVYRYSNIESQRDEIENLVGSYFLSMNAELRAILSADTPDFLMDHTRFASDLERAVAQLEALLESK